MCSVKNHVLIEYVIIEPQFTKLNDSTTGTNKSDDYRIYFIIVIIIIIKCIIDEKNRCVYTQKTKYIQFLDSKFSSMKT